METAIVVEGFVIEPYDVTKSNFFRNPTNKHRKAMLSACDRLLHKCETYGFELDKCSKPVVSGKKQKGYDEILPVRIDIQGKMSKTIGGRDEKFVNVQVQINDIQAPSTIAHVNFESGIPIPKKVIHVAFEKSYDTKMSMWVYVKH